MPPPVLFSGCYGRARQPAERLAVAALVVETLQLVPLVICLPAVVAVVGDRAVEFVLLVRDVAIAVVIPVSGAGYACCPQK
jgi:predicted Kef-type K+ transport protein